MSSFPAPLDDAALTETWAAAWTSLGHRAPAGLLAELMAAWAEPQRHYHDQQHLRECLALWSRWRGHSQRPGELALALWFHDAVYDPRATEPGSNELSSAGWAARAIIRSGADIEAAQRVHDLVMATQHAAPVALASGTDAHLLVDIDLAILGSPPERFARYDQDVRKEYAWVPASRYREGRTGVLQSFMDRSQLYHCEPAVTLLEDQARINLVGALARLVQ